MWKTPLPPPPNFETFTIAMVWAARDLGSTECFPVLLSKSPCALAGASTKLRKGARLPKGVGTGATMEPGDWKWGEDGTRSDQESGVYTRGSSVFEGDSANVDVLTVSLSLAGRIKTLPQHISNG